MPTIEMFRSEAVAAQASAARVGAPLRLEPRWIDRTYWSLLGMVLVALAYAALVRVGEYAHGPAVVRADGRIDVTCSNGGVVMSVEVRPGDRVAAGQALVRFHTESERQDLAHLDREFELKLVRLLLHPNDEGTRQSLASLRAARELAAARLADRAVTAPVGGVVRNLRIRPGQLLAPGDAVATIADEGQGRYSVVALVPGQYRPMLRPGMPLRFSLDGYQQVSAALEVESVDDGAVGPGEVRRYLGHELGDAVPAEGSLVLVRARLPGQGFLHDGQRYPYYDGIPGRVDLRVRSSRLLSLLFGWRRGH
jgi:multidrug efflux pump subunit AcrA (membrane-fusion protein)